MILPRITVSPHSAACDFSNDSADARRRSQLPAQPKKKHDAQNCTDACCSGELGFEHDEAVALPGVVDCVLVLAVEELWLEEFAELTT